MTCWLLMTMVTGTVKIVVTPTAAGLKHVIVPEDSDHVAVTDDDPKTQLTDCHIDFT